VDAHLQLLSSELFEDIPKKKKKTDDHRDILLDKLRTSKEKENGHNELRNG